MTVDTLVSSDSPCSLKTDNKSQMLPDEGKPEERESDRAVDLEQDERSAPFNRRGKDDGRRASV